MIKFLAIDEQEAIMNMLDAANFNGRVIYQHLRIQSWR